MADPAIVLLIVIGVSAGERPRGSVVSGAVAGGLGTNAQVLVEERATSPADADATATADRLGTSAIAEIAWADAAHSRARLHVYLAADRGWYDQTLAFDPADAPEDRERSIGLLVGAMIRARQVDDAVTAPPPEPPAPAPPPLASPAPPPATAPVAAIPLPPNEREESGPGSAPRARSRLGVDVGGFATAGVGGEAQAFGPAVRGRVFLGDSWSAHGGAAVGFGSLPAGASMTTTRIALGGRRRFVTFRRPDLALDAAAEVLVVHHAVRRSDPAASRDRWLSGGHLDLGAAWSVTRAVEPFATIGADVVLGATPITLAGERVAQIPPVRATVEAGARVHF